MAKVRVVPAAEIAANPVTSLRAADYLAQETVPTVKKQEETEMQREPITRKKLIEYAAPNEAWRSEIRVGAIVSVTVPTAGMLRGEIISREHATVNVKMGSGGQFSCHVDDIVIIHR